MEEPWNKPKEKPLCSKCGEYHWYFRPCAEKPLEPNPPEPKAPAVQRIQNLPAGMRVWADRSHTYEQTAPGVFSLKARKYVSHGRVTPPQEG